jgi:hypothetical protein
MTLAIELLVIGVMSWALLALLAFLLGGFDK